MCAKTLFEPIVNPDRLHASFKLVRESPASESARRMLDDIYQSFDDPDGNFLEQFQTGGFDARFFELYLFAYFSRSGFDVDRTHKTPDFLVSKDGLTVAVEATTVNPATSGVFSEARKPFPEMSAEELVRYLREELPIRFGSPLFSKLKKRYWELNHCKELPLVIAIEAFHETGAQLFSDTSLSGYLYGIWQSGDLRDTGELTIGTEAVTKHAVENKEIPSYFFSQPETEHISAVVFTNSGTHAKFSRMGYLHGYGSDVLDIVRTGYFFNPDPDAMDPTLFSYNLDDLPLIETWGEGLVVCHNPRCLYPIPHDYFSDAVQACVENEKYTTDHSQSLWHPISSQTNVLHMGEIKEKLSSFLARRSRCAITSIPKMAFQQMCGFAVDNKNPFGQEHGWFADESGSFLGVIVHDKIDGDWACVVLARDQYFQFRPVFCESSLSGRSCAVETLQHKMLEMLLEPRRIYVDGK